MLALFCALFVSLGAPAVPPSAPAPLRGLALTPHGESRSRGVTYESMVDEIADLGATDLSIVVQWSQTDVAAVRIEPHPKETQDDAVIRRLVTRAHARGLRVLLFPIVWVEQRGPGLWRGTLAPKDLEAWWRDYRRFILHYAALAKETRVALFSVGSELNSMETHEARWRALIAEVRGLFPGRVTYSANWDHFQHVPFWDAVDLMGITAYFELTREDLPTVDALVKAWTGVREVLLDWQVRHGRPVLITEVGWPSRVGAAKQPWNYGGGAEVDLEVQRRCYEAFVRVWRPERHFGGVFFWNWWGLGGPRDTDYTPRRKPAEKHLREFFSP